MYFMHASAVSSSALRNVAPASEKPPSAWITQQCRHWLYKNQFLKVKNSFLSSHDGSARGRSWKRAAWSNGRKPLKKQPQITEATAAHHGSNGRKISKAIAQHH
jgi:hypothetical protein